MTSAGSAPPQTPALGASVPQDGLSLPRRHYATLAIMATMVLVVLDGAIANVALPTIARSLHVSSAASVWVVSAYQLALVMALLPCAALGESLGLRRVFTGGVALFTAASLLCALSPSLPWLVAARFVQGLGGRGRDGARHRAHALHLPSAPARHGDWLERDRDRSVGGGGSSHRRCHPDRVRAGRGCSPSTCRSVQSSSPPPLPCREPCGHGTPDRPAASAALNALAFAGLVLGVDRATTAPRTRRRAARRGSADKFRGADPPGDAAPGAAHSARPVAEPRLPPFGRWHPCAASAVRWRVTSPCRSTFSTASARVPPRTGLSDDALAARRRRRRPAVPGAWPTGCPTAGSARRAAPSSPPASPWPPSGLGHGRPLAAGALCLMI